MKSTKVFPGVMLSSQYYAMLANILALSILVLYGKAAGPGYVYTTLAFIAAELAIYGLFVAVRNASYFHGLGFLNWTAAAVTLCFGAGILNEAAYITAAHLDVTDTYTTTSFVISLMFLSIPVQLLAAVIYGIVSGYMRSKYVQGVLDTLQRDEVPHNGVVYAAKGIKLHYLDSRFVGATD